MSSSAHKTRSIFFSFLFSLSCSHSVIYLQANPWLVTLAVIPIFFFFFFFFLAFMLFTVTVNFVQSYRCTLN